MTSKERAALRAKANPLEPIIQIGKEGISEKLGADVVQVIGGIIVLYREADEERIAEKKKKRGAGTAKATAKKKVKIKGMRQRQREKEAKNPYAKYERPRYKGDRDKKQGRS